MNNFELNVIELFEQGFTIEQIANIIGVRTELVDEVVCSYISGEIASLS